jgi:hypothetical protein
VLSEDFASVVVFASEEILLHPLREELWKLSYIDAYARAKRVIA